MADDQQLTNMKTMLGIEDTKQDDLLTQIITKTETRLAFKSGETAETLPAVLKDDAVEIAISRYNRRANEGMKSYSQTDESIQFSDDDFAPYADDIAFYARKNEVDDGRPKAQFISGWSK